MKTKVVNQQFDELSKLGGILGTHGIFRCCGDVGIEAALRSEAKRIEWYLPEQHHNDNYGWVIPDNPDAIWWAKQYHPKWSETPNHIKRRYEANVFRLFGKDLNTVADLVVAIKSCNNPYVGHLMEMATDQKIRVIKSIDELKNYLQVA